MIDPNVIGAAAPGYSRRPVEFSSRMINSYRLGGAQPILKKYAGDGYSARRAQVRRAAAGGRRLSVRARRADFGAVQGDFQRD